MTLTRNVQVKLSDPLASMLGFLPDPKIYIRSGLAERLPDVYAKVTPMFIMCPLIKPQWTPKGALPVLRVLEFKSEQTMFGRFISWTFDGSDRWAELAVNQFDRINIIGGKRFRNTPTLYESYLLRNRDDL